MITVTLETRSGTSRHSRRIMASTMERALELAGGAEAARVVSPIYAETFPSERALLGRPVVSLRGPARRQVQL